MQSIKDLIVEKDKYSKQELISILKITDKSALQDLYDLADKIRKRYLDYSPQLSGSIRFSTHCCKNCLYCNLRRSNENIHRYRLDENKIIKIAQNAFNNGIKSIILESGEDPQYDTNIIVKCIKEIKESTGLHITLNIGERSTSDYALMKEAGADRYILKHKTSDPILYRQLHPDLKFYNRIKYLRILKELGFEVGSGVIIGVPGQTFESIANDILLFNELDLDMIHLEPYIPYPGTPLTKRFDQAGGYFIPAIGYFNIEEVIYKIIALARIVTKNSHIPILTQTDVIDDKISKEMAIKCGANVFLSNLLRD